MLKSNRQAIFISGKGSNLKALVDTYSDFNFSVYANKECEGLIWARKRGLYTEVVSLKSNDDWDLFAQKINSLCFSKIFLLGFMKIVPELFLNQVKANIVNVHPSFLPAFPGLKAMEKTFEAKKAMGCSFHEVTADVDAGEIILQKKIKAVASSNDFEAFKERVHQFEQALVAKSFQISRGVYG